MKINAKRHSQPDDEFVFVICDSKDDALFVTSAGVNIPSIHENIIKKHFLKLFTSGYDTQDLFFEFIKNALNLQTRTKSLIGN